MRIVREELHRQADYTRTVESKNAKLMVEVNVLRAKETSVEVLREEKWGLERKVRVMEELREKVVRLEAEVEAGRREREAWFVILFPSRRLTFTTIFRANNNNAESSSSYTPSNTPVSITKNLSDLRLAHARLLEEHGANVALLRRRETEIRDLERRESEAQLAIEAIQEDMHALSEKVGRREQRAILAEREVGFLNALVVLIVLFSSGWRWNLWLFTSCRPASTRKKRTAKVLS
jgi:mitotic spindle assembly checkpoint protein MAD1